MSDPAVEAVQRAWDDNAWGPGPVELAEGHLAIAAAREALKPLRELHYPRPDSVSALFPTPLCNCGHDWPCETAPLIYRTEELA